MFSLAKILIPIDFSERSLGAARYAIPLAEHFHSEINLLHVLPPFEDLSEAALDRAAIDSMTALRRRKAQAQLDDFSTAELDHLRVKQTLVGGDPAGQIVEWGVREHSDLIMMPTRGYGLFRRLLLGSVTAKVLHDTDCPVWTGVHLEEGPPAEWRTLAHIACAVDFSADSEKALDWAAQLAGGFKAALSLIHVVPRINSPGEEYYSYEYHQQIADAAKNTLAQMQSRLGTNAEVLLETGETPTAVCAAADREHADLLVIGRGAIKESRLSANAYAIIRRSPCPVISV